MPTEQQHVERAERNEAFYAFLAQVREAPEWQVVVLFYAALHYVDAYLTRIGSEPHTHTERRAKVRKDPNLRPIYRAYVELDDRSRDARYTEARFTADVVSELFDREFSAVRRRVRSLLGIS